MFSGGIEKDEWHDWTNLQSVNKPISEIYFAFIFFVCVNGNLPESTLGNSYKENFSP